MSESNASGVVRLSGLAVAEPGKAILYGLSSDHSRFCHEVSYKPFAWLRDRPGTLPDTCHLIPLSGVGETPWLAVFEDPSGFNEWIRKESHLVAERIRPAEHAYLLQSNTRLFENLSYSDIRKLSIDIETSSSQPERFSDPSLPGDRVLAIGMGFGSEVEYLTLEDEDDASERKLLKAFNERLAELDPDVIIGHNLFRFDLSFLRQRSQRFRVRCEWGRGGAVASFRSSRLKVAERMVDFPRCDIPGRAVFDTYLMVQLWDLTARELPSYGLKAVALHLGISDATKRTFIPGAQIQEMFRRDRSQFLAYLHDDIREASAIADLLLPNYVAQTRLIPMTLQEVCLRGTAQKVESLLLPRYLENQASLPAPPGASSFEGGYTLSPQTGVFRGVIHFDIASLYPSLILLLNQNPVGDSQGVFLETLRKLREERLRYKRLAREKSESPEAEELQARQSSFKILINSFYGYLGFPNARFGDSTLAAEITRRGRELLKSLIQRFEDLDLTLLEADTDGLYVHAPDFTDSPELILEKVCAGLPEGVDLEIGGTYDAMFCYKSKNYALLQNDRILIRGSGLRSRGIEPYLRELTGKMVAYLLGRESVNPLRTAEEWAEAISGGMFPVEKLAKRENLSMNPAAYRKAVEEQGKPRRAALEVALKLDPLPASGDAVHYYLRPKVKGEPAGDWARAVPLSAWKDDAIPYDGAAYCKKLREWARRFGPFLNECD